MEKKVTVNIDEKYSLPQEYSIVEHRSKYIIVAPECSNYIVLENKSQCDFFLLLYRYTIREATKIDDFSESDVRHVVMQIEAKHFFNIPVEKISGRLQMHLFLTNSCNLRCHHCYMNSGVEYDAELSYKELCDLLSSFKNGGGECLILSGGEVTMRPDMMDIIKYSSNIGLEVSIMTNGTIWSDDMVEQASEYLSGVQVSIDGYNDFEHGLVRGTGNFEKALKTVDRFLKKGIRTTVAITPWPHDGLINKVQNYLDFEKSLREQYAGLPLVVRYSADIMDGRDLKLTDEEKVRYSKIMVKLADGFNPHKSRDIFIENQKKKIIKDNWCTYGHLTVTATGNVYFCGKIQGLQSYANIRKTSMEDILKAAENARRVSAVQNLEPCASCCLRYICGGECRIEHFPSFRDCKSIVEKTRLRRECSPETKAAIYDKMIESNIFLYY